jgi:hypothetical protein
MDMLSWINPFYRNQEEVTTPPPEPEIETTFEVMIYDDNTNPDIASNMSETSDEMDDKFICKLVFNSSQKYSVKQTLLSFASRNRKYRMNDKNLAVYIDNIKFYIRSTVAYLLLILTKNM